MGDGFLESSASGKEWGIAVAELHAVGRVHDPLPLLGGWGEEGVHPRKISATVQQPNAG